MTMSIAARLAIYEIRRASNSTWTTAKFDTGNQLVGGHSSHKSRFCDTSADVGEHSSGSNYRRNNNSQEGVAKLIGTRSAATTGN